MATELPDGWFARFDGDHIGYRPRPAASSPSTPEGGEGRQVIEEDVEAWPVGCVDSMLRSAASDDAPDSLSADDREMWLAGADAAIATLRDNLLPSTYRLAASRPPAPEGDTEAVTTLREAVSMCMVGGVFGFSTGRRRLAAIEMRFRDEASDEQRLAALATFRALAEFPALKVIDAPDRKAR